MSWAQISLELQEKALTKLVEVAKISTYRVNPDHPDVFPPPEPTIPMWKCCGIHFEEKAWQEFCVQLSKVKTPDLPSEHLSDTFE